MMEKSLPVREFVTARTDFVERYCPHLEQNVLLRRSRSGDGTRFACLRAESCTLFPKVGCVHGKTVGEE